MRTIGLHIQRIRISRNKTLRVIAGLTGMSKDTLNRIEHGQRDLGLSESVALAEALGIAPAKLIALPIFAAGNGHTDASEQAAQSRTP